MNSKRLSFHLALIVMVLAVLACRVFIPEPTATPVTANISLPTNTPVPTAVPIDTPLPANTPDAAATQKADELNMEVQKYFDKGYITTTNGEFSFYKDFKEDWAQLGWYTRWNLDETASDFFMSAHLKWSTASATQDISGCGFVFAMQENGDDYAVFLDRARILFLHTDSSRGSGFEVGKTRGTGRVDFGNPAETDFAVIVRGAYAYVLVNGDMVGEYTLDKDSPLTGKLGLSIFSGTNKDYGTRCEMTNLHVWIPK